MINNIEFIYDLNLVISSKIQDDEKGKTLLFETFGKLKPEKKIGLNMNAETNLISAIKIHIPTSIHDPNKLFPFYDIYIGLWSLNDNQINDDLSSISENNVLKASNTIHEIVGNTENPDECYQNPTFFYRRLGEKMSDSDKDISSCVIRELLNAIVEGIGEYDKNMRNIISCHAITANYHDVKITPYKMDYMRNVFTVE